MTASLVSLSRLTFTRWLDCFCPLSIPCGLLATSRRDDAVAVNILVEPVAIVAVGMQIFAFFSQRTPHTYSFVHLSVLCLSSNVAQNYRASHNVCVPNTAPSAFSLAPL